MSSVLLTAGLSAHAAGPLIDTSGQRIAFDAFQLCAQLNLPENFSKVVDAQLTAAAAIANCRDEELTLAGQFALENPGTGGTREFIENQRRLVIADLVDWIRGVKRRQGSSGR
ncbi:hypothetical protein GT347_19940 [Xylophilus rhododendri]|uniref:Uncharacterized protein n=1 Tax=Xylophilus rhododendri TaxID=2697032 RepID=A0A857JAP5_9BURK|nr:hypothetical protein [Xylophilus rhododendri]QHJ00053.1 hypothetical protein GT347_19940 [Xylophilus rhododendri]